MAFWGWLLIITILVLIYAIFSLREEIAEGVEDGFERLFDKSYSKAGDPFFERVAKFVGSYKVARRNPPTVTQPTTTAPSSTPSASDSGHPSLATLFKLDLLSDIVVSVVPAIFRRIF
jgi:hypothetical protein